MKKRIIRFVAIGCIGIVPFLGYVKETEPSEVYHVEIIHISQLEKTQQEQRYKFAGDAILFLGWILPL